ncbi:GNAT family N-acetyltransferase [Rubinisphaera margarita]|uniref:GNAT family N-acetyltransferase n=1 Tax=Rubinisphaera margarita TaxID=2909586 RepID=UPI001EE86ABC|nr:GNAT family N-acetyltransferase [Rubinisphaera margarita]MCG6155273.1 GNAT family N-acetyltransferase [Rubinisphaera margarita]
MNSLQIKCTGELSNRDVAAWREIASLNEVTSHPFLQPEFVQAVGKHRPETRVAVIQNGSDYVGFFPYQTTSAGVGHPVLPELTDYHGLIATDALDLSAEELLRKCGLLVWHFDHLPVSQGMFRRHHAYQDPSYLVRLSAGFENYAAELRERKSSVLSQALRKSRKLERELGPVTFHVHEESEEAVTNLVDWKRVHLDRRSGSNPFVRPWMHSLLREVSQTHGETFHPELSVLRAGGQCLAVHFGLRTGNRLVSWIPTFAPEFSQYSPGQVLYAELIRSAADRGIAEIELGRGENQLKLSLSNASVPLAVGAVDLRMTSRVIRSGWFRMRQMVHSNGFLKQHSLPFLRRIKSFVS